MRIRTLSREELDSQVRQFLLQKVNLEGSLMFVESRLKVFLAEKERRVKPVRELAESNEVE